MLPEPGRHAHGRVPVLRRGAGAELGVLAVGSEYGWGTFKMHFTQGPGRLHVFAAKLLALGVALVPFVLVVFVAGALSSYAIASAKGRMSRGHPPRSCCAASVRLADPGDLGGPGHPARRRLARHVAGNRHRHSLRVRNRGPAERSGERGERPRPVVQFFLRANGYSLAAVLGVSVDDVSDNGPGSFSGPFVGGAQAALVLAAFTAVAVVASGWLLRRRDVT